MNAIHILIDDKHVVLTSGIYQEKYEASIFALRKRDLVLNIGKTHLESKKHALDLMGNLKDRGDKSASYFR